MLSRVARLIVGLTLIVWCCAALELAACDVGISPTSRPTVETKNLQSLLMTRGLSWPRLQSVWVNGVALRVGAAQIDSELATALYSDVHTRSASDPSWRALRVGGGQALLSRWSGAQHEVLSVRPLPGNTGCLVNYSRQDLRQPLRRVPIPPARLPRAFSLLSATEEPTVDGAMQLFVFDVTAAPATAHQQLVHTLQASDWRWEVETDARHDNTALRATGQPIFAARSGDRLRAVLVATASSHRLVMQVWLKRTG